MFTAVALLAGALLFFYVFVKRRYRYFADRNVPYAKPTFLFGNGAPIMLKKVNMIQHIQMLYDSHPDAKILGLFDFLAPMFMVRDPDTIKQLTVKDFDHFGDHTAVFTRPDVEDIGTESLFGNSLVLLRGQKWREMRATLSPAFTGSKMRQMFELVADCAEGMVGYLREEVKTGKKLEVEMKDVLMRYTNDVIASVAFGISVDSLRERENEFFMKGQQLMNFNNGKAVAKIMVFKMFPSLANRLKLDITSAEMNEYFKGMIMDNMKQRDVHGIVRNDMVNILMQVRKGALQQQKDDTKEKDEGFATVEESKIGKATSSRVWSDNELAAQCFLFFIAGSETVSTCLTFLSYELLINPDIQEKIYEEIMTVEGSLKGERVSYEVLQSMKYLDMVVSEVLRLWPPSLFTDRYCSKDYQYDDGQGTKVTIKKGQILWIPVTALHHDPKYFPNPYKFDPERFSEENRSNINPAAYLPFGIGPRACIGSRLALMEVKIIAYHLVKHFRLERCEKSKIPLTLEKKMLGVSIEGGVWLELKPRC